MIRTNHISLFLCSICVFLLVGCSSSSDENGDVALDYSDTETSVSFTTSCGTVSSGIVANPVQISAAIKGRISRIISSNLFVLARAEGEQLVKLLALGTSPFREEAAISALNQLIGTEDIYFFPATQDCSIVSPGGGQGTSGQIITAAGHNLSESLLIGGFGNSIDAGGTCGETLINGCYSALREMHTPKTKGEMRKFLWKPKAESSFNPGKLVVHVDACNATVIVSGETLPDFGSGNERCNTSRSQKTGCAYGRNVKVEVIDNETGAAYTHNGEPFVIVPDGCARFQFE